MRILIVDDEPAARARLRRLLDELDVECVGEAANGLEALELARTLRPDLLLLDIAMPEISGLDVARHLGDDRPLVVFQTAHDEHALAAFDAEAADYLLKPVTRERLQRALERAERRLASGERGMTPDTLRRLDRVVTPQGLPARRLLVRSGAGHRLLPAREIALFTAEDGLARAVAGNTTFLTDYTLADLESRFAGAFLRVSRADLVNVDWIDRVAAGGDGSATLTLRDGTAVHVSRRRAAAVRRALER